MSVPSSDELDVEALMNEIRTDLRSRSRAAEALAGGAMDALHRTGEPETFTRLAESDGRITRQAQYSLADFLRFHDEDFVANAYRGLLGREPDPAGGARFLEQLRSGERSKIEVLGGIRYSAEGRAAGVHVRKLMLPFALRRLRRVPVVGHMLGVVQYVVRLPYIVRNLERLETTAFQHRGESRRAVNGLMREVETALARIEAGLRRDVEGVDERTAGRARSMEAQFEQRLNEHRRALNQHLELHEQMNARLASAEHAIGDIQAIATSMQSRVAPIEQRLLGLPSADDLARGLTDLRIASALAKRLDMDLARVKARVLEQQRRVAVLLESVSGAARAQEATGGTHVPTVEREHLLDGFYVRFEDAFRGTNDDIRARVSVYLPFLRDAGVATASAPLLDIGCGRGEWLELLRDEGLVGRGLDSNRAMIAACVARGLDAVETDALDCLRSLDSGSLGAVTAIHVIEHLPFGVLLALFDEVHRVLAPGGICIFETPNPENLIVGACNFWYDPTHHHPLPPEVVRFLLVDRGLTDVEILRLHPRLDRPTDDEGTGALSTVLDKLYGPQDYALVGRKA